MKPANMTWLCQGCTDPRRQVAQPTKFGTALDGGRRSTPRTSRLTPGKETRYSLCRRMCGSQSMSGWVRKIWPVPGFDPRTVQPVGNRLPATPVLLQVRFIVVYFFLLQMSASIELTPYNLWIRVLLGL
jgi:hypothetical protein